MPFSSGGRRGAFASFFSVKAFSFFLSAVILAGGPVLPLRLRTRLVALLLFPQTSLIMFVEGRDRERQLASLSHGLACVRFAGNQEYATIRYEWWIQTKYIGSE
jgi:hypothetical protein